MEAPLEDAILQPPWRFLRGRVVVGRRPWAIPIGSVATLESKAAGCDNRMNLGFNSKHTNNKAMERDGTIVIVIYREIFELCLPARWSMMSVLEMLPISRRELRLSTTGSRSAFTSRNFSRAVPIPWSGDIRGKSAFNRSAAITILASSG